MYEKKELKALVGANIKREREKAGLTQEALSELICLESKTLSAVERGNVGISLSSLLRVCEVLKISPSVILYQQEQRNDLSGLSDQLERLSPEQFAIAREMLSQLLRAFDLENSGK